MFSKPTPRIITCEVCDKQFTRKDNLNRHLKKHVDLNCHHCDECGASFLRRDGLTQHMFDKHQMGGKRKLEFASQPSLKKIKKNPRQFYDLKKISERKIEKYNTTNSTYKVTTDNLEIKEIKDIFKVLKVLFSNLIDDITQFADKDDLIRLAVQSPDIDFPILVPFMKASSLGAEHILSEIERVLQSFEEFVLDGAFEIDIIHVKHPKGGVWSNHFVDLDSFLENKQCIIRIKNKDELCCARAIITTKAKLDKHPLFENSIRRGRGVQGLLANELHEKAGVSLGLCGIEEIKHFQAVLPGYQIHVVSRDHFNGMIYVGPEADNKIFLYMHDNHYDVITSMAAFLNKAYFCTKCNKGYDKKEEHSCNMSCHRCRQIHEQEEGVKWVSCDDCNRHFKGALCFEMHKKQTKHGNSTCSTLYTCTQCNQLINRQRQKKEHKCGEIFCDTCKDFFMPGHECYMQPSDIDSQSDKFTYIFFDFECTQDTMFQCEEGFLHNPVTEKCVNCNKADCGSM